MERKFSMLKGLKRQTLQKGDSELFLTLPKHSSAKGLIGLKSLPRDQEEHGKCSIKQLQKTSGHGKPMSGNCSMENRQRLSMLHSPHSSVSGFSFANASRHIASKSFVDMQSPKLLSSKRVPIATAVPSGSEFRLSLLPAPQLPDSKTSLPLMACDALTHFREELTTFEEREILEYDMVYFVGARCVKLRDQNFDDDQADYGLTPGDHLAYRYEILATLGKGAFGVVAKCWDHKRKEEIAIKVIKNKRIFHQQGLVEIKVLQAMRERDKEGIVPVVIMKSTFVFRKHLCITFELLSISMYAFMRANRYQGLSMHLIRKFAVQLTKTLIFLKKLRIIHCDIKPENILFKFPNRSSIKVIDFGSSCFESAKLYTYIQSRFYRAPEIILGCPYNGSIDMWSLGCVLGELAKGTPLFPGESERHQLALMMEVLGVPPNVLLARSPKKSMYFDSLGAPRIVHNSKGRPSYPNTTSLSIMFQDLDPNFVDFLTKCLDWNPLTRLTPDEAIRHPWLNNADQNLSRTMSGLSIDTLRKFEGKRKERH